MNRRTHALSRRMCMAGLVVSALLTHVAMAGDSYNIRNGTIAGGGGIVEADCFRLVGTLGEAVASTTSASGYRLTSGFPATLAASASTPSPDGGLIFSDGFEGDGQIGDPDDNSGACKP